MLLDEIRLINYYLTIISFFVFSSFQFFHFLLFHCPIGQCKYIKNSVFCDKLIGFFCQVGFGMANGQMELSTFGRYILLQNFDLLTNVFTR